MSLQELHRIKLWHISHKEDHPLEYQLFDIVLTVWAMGWVGYLPALLFAVWALPLCVIGTMLPGIYVAWRQRAHRAGRLRCDWSQAS